MYTGLHAPHPLFWLILMNLEFSRQIFEKYSNIKFHEYPSSGNWYVLCRWTDTTNPIITFRNFANAPKNVLNLAWDANNFLSTLFLMYHEQQLMRSAEMYQTAYQTAMGDVSHQNFGHTKFKSQHGAHYLQLLHFAAFPGWMDGTKKIDDDHFSVMHIIPLFLKHGT